MQFDPLLVRPGIEGARLTAPCHDHLPIHRLLLSGIYCNKIRLRIVGERIICHADHIIFITVIFVDLGKIFPVIQTFLQIQIIHAEKFIRYTHISHGPLHLIRDVPRIREIQDIFHGTHRIQRPHCLIECR